MQSRRYAGKNRAAFRTGFVTNGDDVGKHFAGFDKIPHGLGRIAGNINANVSHRFDDNRIELSRFESRALRFKLVAANLVEKRLGHLTAGAIVDANEQDFLFHNQVVVGLFSRTALGGWLFVKLNFKGLNSDGVAEDGLHLSMARQAVCRSDK